MLFVHRCPLSNVCRWLCTTLRKHSLCLAKSQWRGLIQNTMQVSSNAVFAYSCKWNVKGWTYLLTLCAHYAWTSSTNQLWQAMVLRMSTVRSVKSSPKPDADHEELVANSPTRSWPKILPLLLNARYSETPTAWGQSNILTLIPGKQFLRTLQHQQVIQHLHQLLLIQMIIVKQQH